ncbi:phosphate acyltransferase [Octadecabacter ascidiaceicola]|uniref:Phosphate acetyltransferase n=1 Tax=Octadecabacter ascidiaceicola TaxID=1655543 RepID=A0A238KL50_9RHOB|nr:phosphate acyltransferase [Octadecabacter ascidiaceicola]SMX43484.1 Phosphate acetyltransferase [Octadecabacter ascidiaceicola]
MSSFLSDAVADAPAHIIQQAQNAPSPRVAIARAGAPLPMLAAMEATQANMMVPLFTGERADIEAEADKLGWDISGFEIIDTNGEAEAGAAAALACGEGRADVLMKGQLHTDAFMRAAVSRDAGLRTGKRFVHIFHITTPDGSRSITISDAAVNVNPDIRTRQDATSEVVSLLHKIGNPRPKVAFLSATESPIESVPSSMEGRELRDWAIENIKDADFSGPLAFDLIMSPKAVSAKKLTDDPVAGQADAIIVPDIVSGNALFKSFVYLTGGCAGGIVMGAKVPILLTSRADPAAARLSSIALGAIVAAS